MKNKVYGIHAVQAMIERHPEQILVIYLQSGRQDQRIQQLVTMAAEVDLRVEVRDKKFLDNLASQHQGVLAEIKVDQKTYHENDLSALLQEAEGRILILVLDGVTDPHNLGAVLRTADAAGVTAVLAPKDHAVGITPVVRKIACGAAESVPFIQVTNLARTLRFLQEQQIWIYGTDDQAKETLYQQDLSGNVALVMGAEDQGMRRLTREHCDYLISLPMAGQVSSLNVSVAAGICLFEVVRQRMKI